MYSHRDYLQAVLESGAVHHDSSIQRYDEDKRMLAFFDALLQRELKGQNDNDDENSDDDSDDLSFIIESSDDDLSSDDEEQITLEEINSQTVDLADSTTHSNNSLPRSNQPTIVSLAKNYRIHYIQMIKELTGRTSNQPEKRSLESPTMMTSKRQRPSSSSFNNTLQMLRNQIRNEENEQFYFNDERKM